MNNNKIKSIVGDKIERIRTYIKVPEEFSEKAIYAIGAVAMTTGIVFGSVVTNLSDKIEKNNTCGEFINENRYIVSDNTHRTSDNSGYWYDTFDIATAISNTQNDKDATIYATYKNMSANKIDNMNHVIYSLSELDEEFKEYNSFEGYLLKNGYTDENGKIDLNKYDENMSNYIIELEKNKDTSIGGKTK